MTCRGLVWEKIDFRSLALKFMSRENDSEFVKLLKPIKPRLFICCVTSESCYQTTFAVVAATLSPASYEVLCLGALSLHLQKSCAKGHCTAAILWLEQPQEGVLLACSPCPWAIKGLM